MAATEMVEKGRGEGVMGESFRARCADGNLASLL